MEGDCGRGRRVYIREWLWSRSLKKYIDVFVQYVCPRTCAFVWRGEYTPSIFTPTHSVSLSLGTVVPSTGNFSKFCYPLIFIRFKCFLGKGELPNRPAPFMDVYARIFFYPDFEGGWVHWTYRCSCAITVIVATATCRTNDWLSLLSRHILNAIYPRQCVTKRITMSDELVEKCCTDIRVIVWCSILYLRIDFYCVLLFWWNISVCSFWLVWQRVLCVVVMNAR